DDAPYSRPELLLDLVEGDGRVLDGVVKQAGHQRVAVELHLGEDLGDRYRVRAARFTATAVHAAVGALRRAVRLRPALVVPWGEVVGCLLEAVSHPDDRLRHQTASLSPASCLS